MALSGTNGTNEVDTSKYTCCDAPGVINIPAGEEEDIQAVADMVHAMQRVQFKKHQHMYSGTHARTQGIVKGKLVVGVVPTHLAQTELFSKPGEFPVAIRYSTEPGDPSMDDRVPQPRGLGMKVFNVKGDMFEAGKDWPTHDIEFNSTPVIELADAKTTKEIFELRTKYGGDQRELYKHLEARNDADLQKARDQVYNTHLESITFYSQTAYRFGDYVVKYCLVPAGEVQQKLYEETADHSQHSDTILSEWLQDFYQQHNAEYLFRVQFCENVDEQPVEHAGKIWDPEKYPWQTVAKVIIPSQDSFIPARKTFWEDHIRLDPFQGLKSFEPIGSPNRLRKGVYSASAAQRHQYTGRREINVTSIEQIPDGGYVIA